MRQANMTKSQSGAILAAVALLAMLLIRACAPPASAPTTGIQASGVWARAANAGEMVGVVLAQLKREGAPLIISGGTSDTVDMRSLVGSYAAPEASDEELEDELENSAGSVVTRSVSAPEKQTHLVIRSANPVGVLEGVDIPEEWIVDIDPVDML